MATKSKAKPSSRAVRAVVSKGPMAMVPALAMNFSGPNGPMRMVYLDRDGRRTTGLATGLQARRGSYRAANNPRTRLQTPIGGSGDMHADPWSRRIIREISRDMVRNCDTYATLLDAYARCMVGDGVRALLRSVDEQWNKDVGHMLDRACESTQFDARGRQSLYAMQFSFVHSVAADGDAAMLKLDNTTIQLIESDQITSGPQGVFAGAFGMPYADGVNLDMAGAPVSFTFFSYNQMTGNIDYGTQTTLPAEHVEFVAMRSRITQTRGLPMICTGLVSWERLDSYKESEVIAAEQGSQIYGAVTMPVGNLGYQSIYNPAAGRTGNDVQAPTPGLQGGMAPGTSNIDWHETVAGSMLMLPDGKQYVPINPQRPNRDAAPFMMDMLRQFVSISGLPYEIVYNDLRGLSWSINRAMVSQARENIAVEQQNRYALPFRNIFKWIIANWIAAGLITAPMDWDRIDLAFPRLPWPDEGKEYEAQQAGLHAGLTTRQRLFGPDWRAMLDERMVELTYASELVTKYNTAFPDFETTPREFLGLSAPGEEAVVAEAEIADGGDEMPAAKSKDKGSKTKNPEA